MPHDGVTSLAARSPWAAITAHTKACRSTATNQPAGTRRPIDPQRRTLHRVKSRATRPVNEPSPTSNLTASVKARPPYDIASWASRLGHPATRAVRRTHCGSCLFGTRSRGRLASDTRVLRSLACLGLSARSLRGSLRVGDHAVLDQVVGQRRHADGEVLGHRHPRATGVAALERCDGPAVVPGRLLRPAG
jgi:hypothetical protein